MTATPDELAEARRVAEAAGLVNLTEAHLGQLAESIKANRTLAARLPRDLGMTEEPAHTYRLPLAKGDRR